MNIFSWTIFHLNLHFKEKIDRGKNVEGEFGKIEKYIFFFLKKINKRMQLNFLFNQQMQFRAQIQCRDLTYLLVYFLHLTFLV